MNVVKAAVLERVGGGFSIRELEVPKLDQKHILIRIRTSTTCGTDLHIWRGELPAPMPIILGHESVGSIEEVPSGLRDSAGRPLRVGDRVLWNFIEPCNRCYVCTIEGLPSSCPDRRAYGITVGCGEYPYLNGCYSEAVIVGLNTSIFKVENEIEDSILSPISCALSSVIKAIDSLSPRVIDKALVIGAGPLGLYACAYLSERGVSKIAVIDLVEERLKLAEEFGADVAINLKEHGDAGSVKQHLDSSIGHEGATLALEVAGDPRAVDLGIELLARGGRMATVGAVVKGSCRFDPLAFIRRQVTLRGSLAYEARHMLEGIRFIEGSVDKYPFKRIIGGRYSLGELEQALTDMGEKRILKGEVRIG